MAQYLNKAAGRLTLLGTLACAFGAGVPPAAAQGLADPTRPPNMASPAAQSEGAAPAGPVLQSILISQHRAEAIVSGRTVRVGDRVGDAKVVRITETEVQLREGKALQTLKLFPNIDKHAHSSQGSSGTGAKAEKR